MEWPDDRVILLGQLIGDGSYLNNAPLRYTTASEENTRAVTEAAQREFGSTVRRYAGRGRWHQLLISGNGNRWHPAGVNAWLREIGIFNQRSHEKRIPREAFRLSDDQIALLLCHLWATDGSIHVRRKDSRGSSSISFSTSSRGLAEDVAALLLRVGIVARIRMAHQGDYRPWYNVVVSGAGQQMRFLKAVGGFGPRRRGAIELSGMLHWNRPNTNVDTLPRETFMQVRRLMRERGVTQRKMAALRGTSYGGISHFKFSPSRQTLLHYANILRSEDLKILASSDLFWDRVTAVVPEGEADVFDLTVPGPECWLADGIVSHNSGAIEQDSDIVMFIHREDMYSEDPGVKGLAEIMVAKNRNGPTDKVTLTFLSHLTQFKNYARPQ
jgi:replicative DNA helicase